MRLKVEKDQLIHLLSKTQNIVEKRSTMPVLVNVLLQAEDKALKVYATDLEVSLTDSIEASIQTPGKVAVDAKNLFSLVKELNEGQLEITKKPNHWIEVKQYRSVFNLVGLPHEEYPIFPEYTAQDSLTIPCRHLIEMISKTIYAVSMDEKRYHLNGVYFERDGQNGSLFRMVATDGHRLSLVERRPEIGNVVSAPKPGVIVPRKGLFEIKKLLESDPEGVISLAIEGSQLVVNHKNTVFMVRLIEGKYPHYQQLIPQASRQKALIAKTQFLSTLKRVSLLSHQKSKSIGLEFKNGVLAVFSQNPEMGDAREELEIQYSGEDFNIGFNARYLIDAFTSFEDETIEIHIHDPKNPILLKPKNDPGHITIVMPMRF
jgi:DNA polymerase III subunit beta